MWAQDEIIIAFDTFYLEPTDDAKCRVYRVSVMLSVLCSLIAEVDLRGPRTIMKTPRTVSIQKSSNGKYLHQGLEICLRRCFSYLEADLDISMNFNIDGLPLYKSSLDTL